MASSYRWHSGSSVNTPLWVRARPLLPDELFSSWLVRTAFALSSEVLDVSAQLWPGWRVWTTDIDRNMPSDRLAVLSRYSGIDQDKIAAALLPFHTKVLQRKVDAESAVHPWILTVGARNLIRSGGLQYCPSCLNSDQTPYFRLRNPKLLRIWLARLLTVTRLGCSYSSR